MKNVNRLGAVLICSIAFIFIGVIQMQAQVATGTPPFGSFAGGPDNIDLANINIHWVFPITGKAGRGLPFHYAITFDNSLWKVVSVNGQNTWQMVNGTMGWQWQTQALSGYVTYDTTSCVYSNWVYHDPAGTAHTFSSLAVNPSGCSGVHYGTAIADDGSGYQIAVNTSSTPVATVYPSSGGSITPPLQNPTGGAQIIDDNGNFIVTNDGLSFTDTTGNNVLTINSSYTSYTYPAPPPGGSKTISVGYTNYNVQTNFGCSGIAEYGPIALSLPTSITYPDGSSYQITYEDTPGFPSKTGRIASATLPTGGTISYSYWGGGGGQHGLFCDGTTAAITRTVNDGSNSFQNAYWIAQNSDGTSTTHAFTYPQNDETVINFSGVHELQRKIYQGPSSTGTLLKTVFTCYNNDPTCSATSTVSTPITARDVYTNVGAVTSRVYATYNTYGLPTEIDGYDFTSTTWVNPLKKTIISYATNLGNIVDRPSSVTVKDGNNNTLAQTNYGYDENSLVSTASNNPQVQQHGAPPQSQRGNVTTVSQCSTFSGSNCTAYLTKHFTYYDTGTLSSAQDVNGQNTTYNYDPTSSCSYSYVTSVTAPITSLVSYTGWNCNGGVATSSIDPNGKTNSVTAWDPNFWRPTQVQDELGYQTNISYTHATASPFSPAVTESTFTFNSSNSTVDTRVTLDGLGRAHIVQRKQSPSSSYYDSAETDYDSYGRPWRSTMPYQGTAGQGFPTGTPVTTTDYDALSRPTFVKTLDSQGTVLSTVQSVYVANDAWVQKQPAPTGENLKTWQYENDGLGRLASVCELTQASGSGWGNCAQSNPQNGY